MVTISYHASHEQFSPAQLLGFAKLAEKSGFDACHASDHFHPWSARQGQSGYTFSWLGAAMEATRFPFSVITAPGDRYHPAVAAQAIATLLEMYPDRLEVALGSGEALNEHITGARWPEKPIRNQRLLECANVMRRLLKGDKVNHLGFITVHEARLYTLPQRPPALFCAAITDETAYWAGDWADGLLTIHKPQEDLKRTMAAFYAGGGAGKPVHVQIAISYARNEYVAQEDAYDQWRTNCLGTGNLSDIATVEEFDAAAEKITREKVLESIPVSSDPAVYIKLLQQIIDLGVSNIIVHNVSRQQEDFITDFSKYVLPVLKK